MSHATSTVPVTLLATGMIQGSLGGALVAPGRFADRGTPRLTGAFPGAISLAAVAAATNQHLLPAALAVEDPVALFDHGSSWRL